MKLQICTPYSTDLVHLFRLMMTSRFRIPRFFFFRNEIEKLLDRWKAFCLFIKKKYFEFNAKECTEQSKFDEISRYLREYKKYKKPLAHSRAIFSKPSIVKLICAYCLLFLNYRVLLKFCHFPQRSVTVSFLKVSKKKNAKGKDVDIFN